ncbi:MAG TPA: solute carrier family 23 protein [Chthoniobacterales bacterium]|nr:solute carrier family 23 protein [Chthoniobacterales bacterium]
MFDNIGTLIGVTKCAGLMDANGQVPGLSSALAADSIAAILSSLLGTSTVVSYIESATGVQAGGRTGLTAITTAVCFLLALIFTPVILMIPAVAVAPALVVVGILMFESVSEIDLSRFEACAPAILTLMAMPMTFSISTGIGLGLITLAAVTLGTAKRRKRRAAGGQSEEVHRELEEEEPAKGDRLTPFTYGLAIIFLLHFFDKLLLPH